MNTAGRAFWVIWCCAWAGLWTVTAIILTANVLGHLFLWALAAASLGAIALPVGRVTSRAMRRDA